MKILTVGSFLQIEEVRSKFGAKHEITHATGSDIEAQFKTTDVIFDFSIGQPTALHYKHIQKPVFVNTVFTTLKDWISKDGPFNPTLSFGFCGLNTFFNRDVLEVCISRPESEPLLKSICEQLNTRYEIVKDQVGFVTPRVIGMIINEAYLTAEEGTASTTDIDLAMKLGTNYPFGPFEWAKRVGIGEVIKLMDALYAATKDERYKICLSLRHAV